MNVIEFLCEESPEVDRKHILSVLPPRKSKILETKIRSNNTLYVRLLTNCTTEEEVKNWIEEFEEITKTTYSIRSSKTSAGRYVNFKQILNCQRNTRVKIAGKKRSQNTNCPSCMTVTLHAIKKRWRDKDKEKHALFKEVPCEIVLILTHNHDTHSVDALRFRRVSRDVNKRLISLFNNGHSPASALQTLKTEINLNCDDPQSVLADRNKCPNYLYCYRLYIKEAKEKCKSLDFDVSSKRMLKKKLDAYNVQMSENCVELVYHQSDYAICICPPLFERVHKYVKSASEMVFIDSFKQNESLVFILWTHGDCGGLPLGIVITSSESATILQMGFQLFKNMMGKDIFGGCPDGPGVFITCDSTALSAAINTIWTKSKCVLCVFQVLESVWKWLLDDKNNIPTENHYPYFEEFKLIMFAETVEECFKKYENAKTNAIKHKNYYEYLEEHWKRKELWTLSYRNNLLTKRNTTNNLSDIIMRIIKRRIYSDMNEFNVMQIVDFIMTKFVKYYKMQLLDIANNRLSKNLLEKIIEMPTSDVLDCVQLLTDSIILVPTETADNLFYFVNIDVMLCSCFEGNTGKICKHMECVCIFVLSQKCNNISINNIDVRKAFYCIAIGSETPSKQLSALSNETEKKAVVMCSKNVKEDVSDVEIEEQITEKAKIVIEKITEVYTSYAEQSPRDVGPALNKMYENMAQIHSTSEFVSFCSNFANEYHPVCIQPVAIKRRKILSEQRSKTCVNEVLGKKKVHFIRQPMMKQIVKNLPVKQNASFCSNL